MLIIVCPYEEAEDKDLGFFLFNYHVVRKMFPFYPLSLRLEFKCETGRTFVAPCQDAALTHAPTVV